MGKYRSKKPRTPPVAAQILSAFLFAGALALAFATDLSGEKEYDAPIVPDLRSPAVSNRLQQVHARWKRSYTDDALDLAGQLGIGGSYTKKFQALLKGTTPNVKEAFVKGDFSNVTENDIRNMNVSVLEYVPTNMFKKMAESSSVMALVTPIMEKFLDANRPNALGRLMSVAGDKFDPKTLIAKVKAHGGVTDQKNEAANVLLYNALNKLGDSNGISTENLRELLNDKLLDLVPEEQLMKVKDSDAAKFLLKQQYASPKGPEHDDVDDKALVYQLVNAAYGKAESWTTQTVNEFKNTPYLLAQMPFVALKEMSPSVVADSISTLRNTKFENPLQRKAITDAFLKSTNLKMDEEGNLEEQPENTNLNDIFGKLGNLAAFVNPSVSSSPDHLGSIIQASDNLNLPAPFEAIKSYLKTKTNGKRFDQLESNDIREIGISALKNGPPQLIQSAMKSNSLSMADLTSIGNSQSDSGGIFNSLLKGLISQVAAYAVKQFTGRSGKFDFGNLPGAFLGALGIRGLDNTNNRDLEDIAEKLRQNPDSLDDAQKALILKKFKDAGLLDDPSKLPPEIRALLPRKQLDDLPEGIIEGLPSDSELRLAHGNGKTITAASITADPGLIGTLTPKQVHDIDLADIPAVLAAIRKSKDGPQPQALKALADRFKEYLQSKSEDYETPDRKLLKLITAAEVSKLPATVLAYFVDPKQTRKLPADVRKEIMIAMGELSTKDHANIPTKTREIIILQGLAALDEKLDKEEGKKLGVPELAAIGGGVIDLPPNRIEQLSDVAVEQALETVQGTADDDDDGLKVRPCLSPAQRQAWKKKVESVYGPLESWTSATVTALCCSLNLFDEEDLHKLMKDKIATCQCPADEDAPSHMKDLKKALHANCKYEVGTDLTAHKKILDKVKIEVDLDDLESQILRSKRDADNSINCYVVRFGGSAAPFQKEELENFPENDILNCLYELGKEPLAHDIARPLWDKVVKSRGGVENVLPSDYMNAGHLLSGIRLEEIAKFDLSDPDIVSALGESLGLSKIVLERLASRLENKTRKHLHDFTAKDLMTAKNILCGYSHDKLLHIRTEEFLQALPVLKGSMTSCESTRLTSLASIAMRPDGFGDPSTWSSADIRGIGLLISGMSTAEITKVPAEAFLGITSDVAQSLPQHIMSSLTADQLGFFPRFSAQSLSEEQLQFLSGGAHAALDLYGPTVTDAAELTRHSLVTCYSLALLAILVSRFL